ncbi:hypothetical protein [Streptomyces camelliae]|uniref:Proteinase inhibitor I42 chagasin domain-containing protein n=1 Tax=Streptomyces camelliae TaxID=3004093 RepID=A0ABY7PIZ7_9ACTN|nr:hypothetical protein [Streptomyces sp. HUAS 2-6]WBO69026.1 hypothetical protein O1G22_42840 [Streptomyces sp. HUAS 2-6]
MLAATALAASVLTTPAVLTDAHAAAVGPVGLTNADNGRTVTVKSGGAVNVHLKAVPGSGVKWVWDEPTASDDQVLSRSSGRTVASGDAEATFAAEADGHSTITAHRRCVVTAPGHSCPSVVSLWKTTVDVS